jgi:hypothetical protein
VVSGPRSGGYGRRPTLDVRPQLQVYRGLQSINWRLLWLSNYRGSRSFDDGPYGIQVFRSVTVARSPKPISQLGLVSIGDKTQSFRFTLKNARLHHTWMKRQ